jgi:hypothetical protein
MKRALLVLLVVVLVTGFVRGWIALSTPARQPESNKVDVKLTLDPDKVKEDAGRVKEKAEEARDKAREEIREITRPQDQHDGNEKAAPESE